MRPRRRHQRRRWRADTLGCLSILLLFPPGAGIGYLLAGDIGALWGAGIGVVLGVLLMAMLLRFLRRHR
jgi:hypothetical protein